MYVWLDLHRHSAKCWDLFLYEQAPTVLKEPCSANIRKETTSNDYKMETSYAQACTTTTTPQKKIYKKDTSKRLFTVVRTINYV